MKRETIAKRLEKMNVCKGACAYKLVRALVTRENRSNVIRPCWTSGAGRFCKNLDYTADVRRLLKALRVSFVEGNDAPRGGLTGNFIKINYLEK